MIVTLDVPPNTSNTNYYVPLVSANRNTSLSYIAVHRAKNTKTLLVAAEVISDAAREMNASRGYRIFVPRIVEITVEGRPQARKSWTSSSLPSVHQKTQNHIE